MDEFNPLSSSSPQTGAKYVNNYRIVVICMKILKKCSYVSNTIMVGNFCFVDRGPVISCHVLDNRALVVLCK